MQRRGPPGPVLSSAPPLLGPKSGVIDWPHCISLETSGCRIKKPASQADDMGDVISIIEITRDRGHRVRHWTHHAMEGVGRQPRRQIKR
jgi:hypothetical protein